MSSQVLQNVFNVYIKFMQTGACVKQMVFQHSALFIQIRLTGPTFNRHLMLLTDTGMVYGVSFEDDQLDVNPSFRLCMQPNVIGDAQEPLITKQIYSSQNDALFLTSEG